MDPYRTMDIEQVPEAPRDAGIVGDVIAQFADPNAFYRELVQNAIDAGTPDIAIRIDYEDAEQRVRISVRDRGEGMTREIIEQQLLVLFRSTKENDRNKIGKFGIGFASVLAPNPEVVIVDTARDGRRLTLHLYRDLTYELFDVGPATTTGTTVELAIKVARDAVADLVARSREALERWCRHASVEIVLTDATSGELEVTRIDRPLALDSALVSVARSYDDGQLTVLAGIHETSLPYTGFFNHGLMLLETTEPFAGRVILKIQDARLGHTLSRDDVRRDDAFDRAIAAARELVAGDLVTTVAGALREAAAIADPTRHRALRRAIVNAELALAARDWTFALVDPLGERRVIAAAQLGARAWAAPGTSSLTALLAARGTPVLHVPADEVAELAGQLRALGTLVTPVADELTGVVPIEPAEDQRALISSLASALAAAKRAPAAIVLADLEGAYGDAFAIAGLDEPGPYAVDRSQAARSPFARLRRPPLVISATHPYVVSARAAAAPQLAASHLARRVLLHYRLLDVEVSARLLAHTLEVHG